MSSPTDRTPHFTPEMNTALAAPLSSAHVKIRTQAGRTLSYVEGWMAISEANRIFGFDGWMSETVDIRLVAERERKIGDPRKGPQKDGWGVSYCAKVRVDAHGVVREGIGSGHGIDVDLGLAHESAIKEAETDARKRALMTFGNPFGLALYDKTQANVVDEREVEQTAFLQSAEKSLSAAAMLGSASLKTAWTSLLPQTREAFGGVCPTRFKEIAAKHDTKKEAA